MADAADPSAFGELLGAADMPAVASESVSRSTADGWTPLLLSTIAGMSTCLGAAIVFCHPKRKDGGSGGTNNSGNSSSRVVSPSMMAFSLSLAGSVMLTVSVISIGPECLFDPRYEQADLMNNANINNNSEYHKWLRPWSYLMFQRVINFALGCGLYGLLRMLFPEPDQVEAELFAAMNNAKNDENSVHGTRSGGAGSMDEGDDDIEAGANEEEMKSIHSSTNKEENSNDTDRSNAAAAAAAGDGANSKQLLRRRTDSRNDLRSADSDGSEMENLLDKVPDDGNTNASTSKKDDDAATDDSDSTDHSSIFGGRLVRIIKKSGGERYKERRELVRRAASTMSDASSSAAAAGARPTAQSALYAQYSIASSAASTSSHSRARKFQRWASGEDLGTRDQKRAWRVAMLLFVSLMVHNFPEGLAVAASALEADKLGITVTIGIAIHNIPEGIAVSVPCLAARPDSPWLSFALASLSGLAEPAGAFVSLLFLRGFGKTGWMSLENVLAFVAGIMITVALVELFPEAKRQATTTNKYLWMGTAVGAIVMIVTEVVI